MDDIRSSASTERPAQLVRIPYKSEATGQEREYLVYLPIGYDAASSKEWPVLMFLHGAGERGDGKSDLDYIMLHGPVGEAWIYKRDLPFILIGPQLPGFGMVDQLAYRTGVPLPKRLDEGVPQRSPAGRGSGAVKRALDDGPAMTALPNGWERIESELMAMIDNVLNTYNADPDRVYLSGLSYGGYGTFMMASRHPDRFAAVAPICGSSSVDEMNPIAESTLPIWIIQGGRDDVIKAGWTYPLFNALEEAGHPDVRLTIHEDLAHNVWSRVYSGSDLYDWLLEHHR